MNRMKLVAGLACVAGAVVLAAHTHAFSLAYAKWASPSVVFYVNPSNLDVTATSAENAFKVGMNAWTTQAQSNFRYIYGGRVSDTRTGNDGRNVVVFRNASSGSALATTYSWWSGTTRIDSDIIVWDGAYRFYTGTSGCSSGVYLEDVLTHELGHSLGLNHSSNSSATMYPTVYWCSMAPRTLAADDIAGAQALYGVARTSTTNTAPAVTISSPTGGTFATTTAIAFTGSATDTQDGSLTSRIVWRSNLMGQIGTGGSFSRTLTAGAHDITATVTDSGGLSTSKRVAITVGASTSGPRLTVRGYVYGTGWRVDLTWTGFTVQSVDVYKNGVKYTTTTNDGATQYSLSTVGTYRWKLCAAGTSICSNEASVTF
jgi:hypothetical protein